MASELRVNTLKDASGNNSIGMSYVAEGSAKVWANSDGTAVDGTADLTGVRDSFNLTSIVDNGTGDHTLAYTNNMGNANYALTSATITDLGANRCCLGLNDSTGSSPLITTSQIRTLIVDLGNNALRDQEYNFVSIHGDLA